jgi:hypothetical protein
MTDESKGRTKEMLRCHNCGENNRLVVGAFGAASPFAVSTGRALGIIPVGHPSYLQGVVCLACGSVQLRLAEKDLEHLRSKIEGQ